jgi:UDP-N-acetylmuramyl tripeptide synthase
VAVISGTNGKTTTAHLLSHILRSSSRDVITNRSGANLMQSINTTMLEIGTELKEDSRLSAVLECDEFALSGLTATLKPSVVTLTNLFRDQLDRYAEIDQIERRWSGLIDGLPNTTVVALADDPRLAWLAARAPGGFVTYGLRAGAADLDDAELTHDSEDCPACGHPLDYDWHSIGHQGSYRCPACGLARPQPWLEVEIVESHGFAGQTLRFRWPGCADGSSLFLALPGIANAYNAAAAVCAASVLGVAPRLAVKSLAGVPNAWGRFETATIDGRRLVLTLGKNPASVAEVLRIAAASDIDGILFVMNDGYQDGRDVSWYWDVNPAQLVRGRSCAIAGTRALDLALRVKYERGRTRADRAELPKVFDDPMAALRWLLDQSAVGATVLAISTYTGLVELREALVARDVLAPMPV